MIVFIYLLVLGASPLSYHYGAKWELWHVSYYDRRIYDIRVHTVCMIFVGEDWLLKPKCIVRISSCSIWVDSNSAIWNRDRDVLNWIHLFDTVTKTRIQSIERVNFHCKGQIGFEPFFSLSFFSFRSCPPSTVLVRTANLQINVHFSSNNCFLFVHIHNAHMEVYDYVLSASRYNIIRWYVVVYILPMISFVYIVQ